MVSKSLLLWDIRSYDIQGDTFNLSQIIVSGSLYEGKLDSWVEVRDGYHCAH